MKRLIGCVDMIRHLKWHGTYQINNKIYLLSNSYCQSHQDKAKTKQTQHSNIFDYHLQKKIVKCICTQIKVLYLL